MRLLLTALLLLPSLGTAQQLHTFKNGEVADADKINENFDALMLQIASGDHPEGDIEFTDSDTFSFTNATGSFYPPQEVISYETGLDITISRGEQELIQQGIPFSVHSFTRVFGSVDPDNHLFCPENTSGILPYQSYTSYVNSWGGLVVGSAWDWGEAGGPTIDNIRNNETGSYLCFTASGQVFASVYRRWYGGTGRYRCAESTTPQRFEAYVEGVSDNLSIDIGKLPSESNSQKVGVSSSNSDYAPLRISIPAECPQNRAATSTSTKFPQTVNVFGSLIALPEQLTTKP